MINYKKPLLVSFLIINAIQFFAADPLSKNIDLYGFVRNDLYFNSRQNTEGLDGLFNMFPKSKEIDAFGGDLNDKPNSEMLSVATRLGMDIKTDLKAFGAKSSAKIEFDFAGISSNYYLIRLRQAYMKLNWSDKTELLIGQTWHPMFGNVYPNIISLNAGSPFQPFNRSPQIRLTENLTKNFSIIAMASYQMQYLSQGPVGASASYMKNALLPNIFLGLEHKTANWISGVGFDTKTIKINNDNLSSFSGVFYSQYINNSFQAKVKILVGENMSDHLMMGGYGISGYDISTRHTDYTNFNTLSSWINIAYGKIVQVGVFSGISQNLGTNKTLMSSLSGYTAYGYGFSATSQSQIDGIFRIAPFVAYNISNIKLALEYELTNATYGIIENTGRVKDPYSVTNHRALVSLCYNF